MATITLSNAAANDALTAILNNINAGSAVSYPTISIYNGTKPAGPDTNITSQVLLGTLNCSVTAGVVSSRQLNFNPITQDASADATSTATWARIINRDNAAVVDVDVSTVGGSGFLQMNTTSIVSGGPILINSMQFTL